MPTFDPSQFINKNPVESTPDVYEPTHTFEDFGLSHTITNTLDTLGHTKPSPIQDQVIPHILERKDIVGIAETGTGKTAAFLLPLIHMTNVRAHHQTLILTPTRELALQIEAELRKLARGMRIFSTVCVGGAGIGAQIRGLKRSNHFVIGTPGRVLDLMQRKVFLPQHVSAVVLDEADRMLDMGFIHDMRHILGAIPSKRHTLFFSATMPANAEKLVSEFMKHPTRVSVRKKDTTDSIAQDVVPYELHTKYDTLVQLLKSDACTRAIVFGSMKHSVEKLSKQLTQSGVPAASIHGNKSHGQRQRALTSFKKGEVSVLVATDVAARGIHVEDVSHVVNYDLPGTFEDYIHRIGRTGRADKRGVALTFVARSHKR